MEFIRAVSDENWDVLQCSLDGKCKAPETLLRALARKRSAKTPDSAFFSSFLIARSLLQAGVPSSAAEVFNQMLPETPSRISQPIAIAAMECVEVLHSLYPGLGFSLTANAAISSFLKSANEFKENETLREAALSVVMAKLDKGKEPKEELDFLKGTPYENYAKGLAFAKAHDARGIITQLEPLTENPSLPRALKAHTDEMRTLLANAYYEKGQFRKAAEVLAAIPVRSIQKAHAVIEVAWADLLMGDFATALGSVVSLGWNWFFDRFVPEGTYIAAIAFNERCYYPEALKEVGIFRDRYSPSVQWLTHYLEKSSTDRPKLYPMALASLKQTADVPPVISSEWIRSPVFIADQELIGLQAAANRQLASLLKDGVVTPTAPQKGGTLTPEDLAAGMAELRALGTREKARSVEEKKSLILQIERNLIAISERMSRVLANINKNVEFLEAEVYDGASQDLFWENAHTGYREQVQSGELAEARSRGGSQIYRWGRTNAALRSKYELWEDEVGSIRLLLSDNCADKENYKKLLKKKRRSLE